MVVPHLSVKRVHNPKSDQRETAQDYINGDPDVERIVSQERVRN